METSVLLIDRFDENGQMLYESFKQSHFDGLTIVIHDEGQLPDDVISVYREICGQNDVSSKPRYFNQIEIKDYWDIRSSNQSGEIYDFEQKKANIYYIAPTNHRLVKMVQWLNDDMKVICTDHYDLHGNLYARTLHDENERPIMKSYFSLDQHEIIYENYKTSDIIVDQDDTMYIFHDQVELVLYLLNRLDIKPKRLFYNSLSVPFFVSEALDSNDKQDVLFWQESRRNDIPGNMQFILDGHAKRTNTIYVQNSESYDALKKLGANVNELGFIHDFKKDNGHTNEILICTNSDQIKHIEKLIIQLPEYHFNIVALTEMSNVLIDLDRYENVSLYPSIKEADVSSLFMKCDVYLDINYSVEILKAVKSAFEHNLLIMGFEDTLHDRKYVLNELRYHDVSMMIDKLKELVKNKNELDHLIEIQHQFALAESVDKYEMIINKS